MSKKKAEGARALIKRLSSRKKRQSVASKVVGFASNPLVPKDLLLKTVGPGIGAYALSRFLARIARVETAKRWPRMSPHLTALATVLVLLSAWLGGRTKTLRPYQTGLMVGASIGAVQTLIQTYIPTLGWIFDAPNVAELPAPSSTALVGPVGDDELDIRGDDDDDDEPLDEDGESLRQGVFAN